MAIFFSDELSSSSKLPHSLLLRRIRCDFELFSSVIMDKILSSVREQSTHLLKSINRSSLHLSDSSFSSCAFSVASESVVEFLWSPLCKSLRALAFPRCACVPVLSQVFRVILETSEITLIGSGTKSPRITRTGARCFYSVVDSYCQVAKKILDEPCSSLALCEDQLYPPFRYVSDVESYDEQSVDTALRSLPWVERIQTIIELLLANNEDARILASSQKLIDSEFWLRSRC